MDDADKWFLGFVTFVTIVIIFLLMLVSVSTDKDIKEYREEIEYLTDKYRESELRIDYLEDQILSLCKDQDQGFEYCLVSHLDLSLSEIQEKFGE